MITITNEKVAGFDPRWAAFRGFSLLFDNPGRSMTERGSLAYLDSDVAGEAELSLYRGLRDSLEQLGRDHLTNTYLFCPLPPASYHVTVWDGVNAANVAQVAEARRAECERFLRELPLSLTEDDLFPEVLGSHVVSNPDWNIRLRFERLEKWSNVSIVARLAPADDASAAAFDALASARAALSDTFGSVYWVRPGDFFVTHVTLGYFAHPELAEQANPFMDEWNHIFWERTLGLTLEVRRVSLYGFTDMATFFKASTTTVGRLI